MWIEEWYWGLRKHSDGRIRKRAYMGLLFDCMTKIIEFIIRPNVFIHATHTSWLSTIVPLREYSFYLTVDSNPSRLMFHGQCYYFLMGVFLYKGNWCGIFIYREREPRLRICKKRVPEYYVKNKALFETWKWGKWKIKYNHIVRHQNICKK